RDTSIVGRLCETALQGNGICPKCLTIRKAVSTLAERQRVNAMASLFRAPLPDFSKSLRILARVNRPDQSRAQRYTFASPTTSAGNPVAGSDSIVFSFQTGGAVVPEMEVRCPCSQSRLNHVRVARKVRSFRDKISK